MQNLIVVLLAVIAMNASYALATTHQYIYGETTDGRQDTTQILIKAIAAQQFSAVGQ